MINFSRAFDLAWERVHVILFRPFDLGKWCAMGLSAFLAGMLQGGNGLNGSFNSNNFKNPQFHSTTSTVTHTPTLDWNQARSSISHALSGPQSALMIVLVLLGLAVGLAIVLLLLWLGARGQFMFLDNVVRNRGAISWPWGRYAREANSLFLFYVLLTVISLAVFIPILVIAAVMAYPLFRDQRWPVGGEIAGFGVLGLVYFAVALVFSVILFLFREFGIPLMFRNGLSGRAAFMETLQLIKLHPGSLAVFVLLRIAIFLAVAVLSVCLCCVTCCLAAIPYVGTVILLPVLVYVRCFSLDCLAQFGPQYDAWTVDVPGAALGGAPPLSPPPQPV
jgi:hypothetical protein